MSIITEIPEPNLWDDICKDFEKQRPPFEDNNGEERVTTPRVKYDPAKVTPVFYGKMFVKVESEEADLLEDFDPARSHPACVGYAFVDRPPRSPSPPPAAPPDKHTCIPRIFLEHYIFPVLLPALEEMLRQAKIEKCFERKRTKFNAVDFLTEYLYRNNSLHEDRTEACLMDIPFVQEWLRDHPRPPLPMSLIWTEEEAAVKIQSFWRGYKVRLDPEVHELRQWQREWRQENEDIKSKVHQFWAKKMPNGSEDEDEAEAEAAEATQNTERSQDLQSAEGADEPQADMGPPESQETQNNSLHEDRTEACLMDIPFVQEWLRDHPRPPLPMSLIWTEEEAAVKIQSFWRGYKVRLDPEVHELRQWQREWRQENEDIKSKVHQFWAKKMPNGSEDEDEAEAEAAEATQNTERSQDLQSAEGADEPQADMGPPESQETQ